MQILSTPGWQDYELLDSGAEQRLERFGKFIIARPDPQAIWQPHQNSKMWEAADATFHRTHGENGEWITKKIPATWPVTWKKLKFSCKLTPFKHTGVFPEQAAHWDFIQQKIAGAKTQPNILNLFAYTGIATLAAAAAGAKVTHVDASYPTINWAKENATASGLTATPIRWILDDALKFIGRELKRCVRYDGIIMDPPIFGHGPDGKRWQFHESFPELIKTCRQILTPRPLFIIVNAYAISASSIMLANVLQDHLANLPGKIIFGELALQEKSSRLLSTGIFARYEN